MTGLESHRHRFLLYVYVYLAEGVRVARLKYVSNAGSLDEKI
jgi:hypothetical protein